MGCFSFLCKVCGEPINSDSIRGQEVILFALKDGKVIQKMEGEYDSYGRVFSSEILKGELRNSIEWENPNPDDPCSADDAWGRVCDLMFSDNTGDGIAAIHKDCMKEGVEMIPTTRSENDPNQGWGSF